MDSVPMDCLWICREWLPLQDVLINWKKDVDCFETLLRECIEIDEDENLMPWLEELMELKKGKFCPRKFKALVGRFVEWDDQHS